MYRITVEDFFALPDSIRDRIEDRLSPNTEIEIAKGMIEITESEMFSILKNIMQQNLGTDDVDFVSNDATSWSWKAKKETAHKDNISEFIWNKVEKLVING